jgi:DNA-binding response OmpR family regulator
MTATAEAPVAVVARRLFVVDDDPNFGSFVRNVAEVVGFEVRTATMADEFKAQYRGFSPEIILLELSMPGTDGVELLRFLANEKCHARILIVSEFDRHLSEAAQRLGNAYGLTVAGVILKPVRAPELRSMLTHLM